MWCRLHKFTYGVFALFLIKTFITHETNKTISYNKLKNAVAVLREMFTYFDTVFSLE